MREKTEKWLEKWLIQLIYIQVWAGALGSLYFSQVLKLPPCSLCITQRFLMYPLVIIISVGLWKRDKNLPYYVLPFSILGLIVAGYHNLIYWHVISDSLVPCSVQLPCTVKDFSLLGFVTIPLMSFAAFLLVTVGTIIWLKLDRMINKGR